MSDAITFFGDWRDLIIIWNLIASTFSFIMIWIIVVKWKIGRFIKDKNNAQGEKI